MKSSQVIAAVATVCANLTTAERRELIGILTNSPADRIHADVKGLVTRHMRNATPATPHVTTDPGSVRAQIDEILRGMGVPKSCFDA